MKRLTLEDLDWATDLLVEAFTGHPPATTLLTGTGAVPKLRYFMRCTCRYALMFGEGYAAEGQTGVALWLLPGGTALTPGRMFRAGMFQAPFRFGPHDLLRFGAFARHTDRVHRAAVPGLHAYLIALAVRPAAQGRGVAAQLVQPMLARAEGDGLPVYLETQAKDNAALYQRWGFRVADMSPIGRLGLTNWGLVRG